MRSRGYDPPWLNALIPISASLRQPGGKVKSVCFYLTGETIIAGYQKRCSVLLASLAENTRERQSVAARPFIVAVEQGIG